MDRSNGYEGIAAIFLKGRGKGGNGIGASTVRDWARTINQGSTVLDLGCGSGMPITKVLLDEGLIAYAVDASPSMAAAFRQNFPNTSIACEGVEDSYFFNLSFDGIIAWGLIFLMPAEAQVMLIPKMATALKTGGKLLFTSPCKAIEWEDAMTGQWSRSLGAEKYKELISSSGLTMIGEFADEGENHYYHAMKIID